MKDALGNLIKVGDYLAYPGHQGSQTWLNIGRVTKLSEQGGVFVRKRQLGRDGDITSDGFTAKLCRAVVIAESTIPLDLVTLLA